MITLTASIILLNFSCNFNFFLGCIDGWIKSTMVVTHWGNFRLRRTQKIPLAEEAIKVNQEPQQWKEVVHSSSINSTPTSSRRLPHSHPHRLPLLFPWLPHCLLPVHHRQPLPPHRTLLPPAFALVFTSVWFNVNSCWSPCCF